MFDPNSNKYPYPQYTDEHYITIKKDNGLIFDENYPYIDHSFKFRFIDFLVRILLYLIVFPMSYFKLGLRIKGKSNLKKHKKVLSNGYVSVSNHINFWDYIAIMNALKPHRLKVIVWANNIRGENSSLLRHVGAIPIPDNHKGVIKYNKAINDYLSNKGHLHVYSEGSMWEYYCPIRPFKIGASSIAINNNKPVLPLAFSYRKPSWIRKHIFKQEAALTLTIGEPLFKNDELAKNEQIKDLTVRTHEQVCLLAGIKPNENIYPPLFNKSEKKIYY